MLEERTESKMQEIEKMEASVQGDIFDLKTKMKDLVQDMKEFKM